MHTVNVTDTVFLEVPDKIKVQVGPKPWTLSACLVQERSLDGELTHLVSLQARLQATSVRGDPELTVFQTIR